MNVWRAGKRGTGRRRVAGSRGAARSGCRWCSRPHPGSRSGTARRRAHDGYPDAGRAGAARKKADAETYAKANSIKITVNQSTVRAWVQDTTNDATLRKGLLNAWNLDASAQWTIDEPADLTTSSNPFHHSNFQEYQDFTKTSTGVKVTAFGGPVSAFYNRGAPKLGSSAKDWGKSKQVTATPSTSRVCAATR